MKIRFPVAVLVVLLACLILAAGCTGGTGGSQPPARTLTIPTTRPATPMPVTTAPVQTEATTAPVTTVIVPAWTPGTITQDGTSILIRGDVLGYKASQGNYLAEIRFKVVKAPRAEPVTFEIPSTQIIFKKSGINPYGVNYEILSGDLNGDRILDEGERFLVRIRFTSDASQYAIYGGQTFTMAIKNPPRPDVLVTASAPAVLTSDPVVLASA